MRKEARQPTVFQDIGALADLYLDVFALWGRRLRRGRRWEEHLARFDPALVLPREQEQRPAATARSKT